MRFAYVGSSSSTQLICDSVRDGAFLSNVREEGVGGTREIGSGSDDESGVLVSRPSSPSSGRRNVSC
jgi:hypothetical protein